MWAKGRRKGKEIRKIGGSGEKKKFERGYFQKEKKKKRC